MQRYLCIHGHFYQPPRENPWLEAVEVQDSAYPYHDWNERITGECYAANARSRILDGEGRIDRIASNYARMSFNFGPTLLAWLAARSPSTYRAIREADRESQERFSGHGAALGQVYNHMILPLANRRDKETQVRWGIADFEHRFGRRPEGMWLAETAVDLETLECLAGEGIAFTILAPHQARRWRRLGARSWRDASGGRIDPSRAYVALLPSGRRLSLFFYDGPISRAVAFEGLLDDGERFRERLKGAFTGGRDWPQLSHIATDGESYGHHHRHGDMALAYVLDRMETDPQVRLTVYGEYLERHPPTEQVEIFERTSWSCAHGIDRWWKDCTCNSGGHPGWNQGWRTPLRDAFDWLRDDLGPRFEERARAIFPDPWGARDDYIRVILDRSAASRAVFLEGHARRPLEEAEEVQALKLLELERHLLLMYTSCGWFFDEVSGIETVQVIAYAARAIQLAREALGHDPEAAFLQRLAHARSNIAEHRDGAHIYEKWVRPAAIDLEKLAAHYAISSLFDSLGEKDTLYCFDADRQDSSRMEAGRQQLLVGRAVFRSRITGESATLSYGVLHLGDHSLQAGVRVYRGEEAYDQLVRDAREAFLRGEIPEVVRQLDRHFEGATLSLKSLFRDEQRRVLAIILESSLAEAEAGLRQIYETNGPLMRFLAGIGTPAPPVLKLAAEHVLNGSLRRALGAPEPDPDRVGALLDAAARESVALDAAGLKLLFGQVLERLLEELGEPGPMPRLERLQRLLALALHLPFPVELWGAQDRYYELRGAQGIAWLAELAEEERARWLERFRSLGESLGVRPREG